MQNTVRYLFVWGIILLIVSNASAQIPENVVIHGFGGWTYGKTDETNRYLVGDEEGEYDHVNFSLNITANPYERLSLHVQTGYNETWNRNEVELDYAFAEWFLSDALSFRIGKVKAPFMFYTEVYDVGTTRPFFFLPQGVYQDFAAEAYNGAGITGSFLIKGGWELMYDLYGGKLALKLNPIINTTTRRFDLFEPLCQDLFGGRLTLRTPLDGITFSLSSYTGDTKFKVNDQIIEDYPFEDRYTLFGTSAEYLTDHVWVRSEYLTQQGSNKLEIDVVYLETAYKFTEHWQIAARCEWADFALNTPDTRDTQEPLVTHEEIVLGLNYWVNVNLVFKFSYHLVKGNRFAFPEKVDEYLLAYQIGFDERTNLFAFGVQFSF